MTRSVRLTWLTLILVCLFGAPAAALAAAELKLETLLRQQQIIEAARNQSQKSLDAGRGPAGLAAHIQTAGENLADLARQSESLPAEIEEHRVTVEAIRKKLKNRLDLRQPER